MRDIVDGTIRHHCAIRQWQLHSVNARTNHVHVVVSASGFRPETVRNQLKAWCTRLLKPIAGDRHRFWTEGGSSLWLNEEDALEQAILYVRDAQDQKWRDQQ